MAFYSDYSSEEDYEDNTDYWNPNELIDRIQATQDANERAKLKRELLEVFLEQQRPMLTQKMKDFLLEDGVLESLIGFVNRLDEAPSSVDEKRSTPTLKYRDLNPAGREDNVRKSYNVMDIFHNPMNDLDDLIDEKLGVMLTELFKVFLPTSSGNYHHFHKILNQLLVRAPVETTTILIQNGLVWKMLDFVHETPIADALIDTFCCNFPKQNEVIAYYKSLVEHKIYDHIGGKIYNKGEAVAPFAAEFFVRLLEKLSTHELAGILFINLCRSSTFIDELFRVLIDETDAYPVPQKQGAANVLRELLLRSGEKSFESHEFARPIPNMLSTVHEKLHEHAKGYVGQLCNVLVNMEAKKWPIPAQQFSSYVVKRPFGFYVFTLTEILSDLISVTPETLNQVPGQGWRVLSTWFVEYSHNNLYHFMFFKIFRTLLIAKHDEAQRTIFVRYKFLTKLIETFKAKECAPAKGFIILLCNFIRLTADAQENGGFLKQYLQSHDLWKSFLPALRAETLVQLKRYSDMGMYDDLDNEDEEEDGIDLGSAYAQSLGFDQEAPRVEEAAAAPKKKKKKNRKKKKTPNGTSVDGSPLPQTKAAHGAEDKSLKEEIEDSEGTPAEAPAWWKDLTADLETQSSEEQASSAEWWKDLKSELNTLSTATNS